VGAVFSLVCPEPVASSGAGAASAGHNLLTMTQEIELEETEVSQLLAVLSENEDAVSRYNGVRWKSEDAAQIEKLRENIQQQVNA